MTQLTVLKKRIRLKVRRTRIFFENSNNSHGSKSSEMMAKFKYLKGFSATDLSKFFSGNDPCLLLIKDRRFVDYLCLHHQEKSVKYGP